MTTDERQKYVGLLVFSTFGAVGFGVWMESVGAYFFAWVVLLHVNARLLR